MVPFRLNGRLRLSMAGKKTKDDHKGPATIQNRKASHEFHFEDTLEAGLVLVGAEVKSLFKGRAHLTDAYAKVKDGELWLYEFDIEPYEFTSAYRPERRRDRKLLAHKREIEQLRRASEQKGFSLVPTKVYFKNGKAKVLIAVARGKKLYDKREASKERDQRRDLERGDF